MGTKAKSINYLPPKSNEETIKFLAFLTKTLLTILPENNADILDTIVKASKLFLNCQVDSSLLREIIDKGTPQL